MSECHGVIAVMNMWLDTQPKLHLVDMYAIPALVNTTDSASNVANGIV